MKKNDERSSKEESPCVKPNTSWISSCCGFLFKKRNKVRNHTNFSTERSIPDTATFALIEQKKVRILSIDGGGIRGILPAVILREIQKITKKHPSELFDMIVGTSIGGILALGLTTADDNDLPLFQTEDLVKFFLDDGKQIFPQTNIWKSIESMGGLREEKYDSNGIDSFLQKKFVEKKLTDSLTNVMITSFEIERYKPWNFKSWDKSQDFHRSFVARSTSAAPTYFEPASGKNFTSEKLFHCIDGGVINNNPALLALTEAKKLFPNADQFYLLSLGTGKIKSRLRYDNVKNWGVLQWIKPLIDLMMEGTSQTVHINLKNLLTEDSYVRLQIPLEENLIEMDNTSPENISNLIKRAEDYIDENREIIKKVCDFLMMAK